MDCVVIRKKQCISAFKKHLLVLKQSTGRGFFTLVNPAAVDGNLISPIVIGMCVLFIAARVTGIYPSGKNVM